MWKTQNKYIRVLTNIKKLNTTEEKNRGYEDDNSQQKYESITSIKICKFKQ